jgi:acyl-CoA reductase-like NAD-dependent aldehyde dehydrogenase
MSAADARVKVHGLFIDGKEVPAATDERLDVLNPATGEVLARISHATDEDVDRAVRSARAAFEAKEWASMSNRTRARLINKLADVFEANLEEMFTLETANNGRSVNETRAQISRLPDFFRYNAGLAIARRDSVIPVDGN